MSLLSDIRQIRVDTDAIVSEQLESRDAICDRLNKLDSIDASLKKLVELLGGDAPTGIEIVPGKPTSH